ncbi:hypothetical protein NS506_03207 [Nocardia seriolae]|uniref:Uncharacterized protein n=1 Tax=Nocardia seriolae TaxID=37332 RepID=A0ABC8ASI9_9NOCA|nr:hypothetical protein [Nocardia seriolae]APA97260.1 hypothetical protein NS506_03207 [Nocardia seriolae]
MVPLNNPPVEAYTLLPAGGSVQVGKTGEHFDRLSRYRTASGVGVVIVTLVPVEERTARTVKRVVEVRLDGVRIGQLTPAMSEKFLPAVDHLLGRGLVVAAPAVVTASTVSAKVGLQAQKAFELSPEVLNGAAVMVPARGIERPKPPEAQGDTVSLDAAETEVQTAVLASGSRITVTESPSEQVVSVAIEFVQPLTTWQSRVASEVSATGRRLLGNGSGPGAGGSELTDRSLVRCRAAGSGAGVRGRAGRDR